MPYTADQCEEARAVALQMEYELWRREAGLEPDPRTLWLLDRCWELATTAGVMWQ